MLSGSVDLAGLIGDSLYPALLLRLPWEKSRELRAQRLSTVDALERLNGARTELALHEGEGGFARNLSLSRDWETHIRSAGNCLITEFEGAEVIEDLGYFESSRRATLLVLALEAYRLEHGELPATYLRELQPSYLNPLPNDPYSGREFLYFPRGVPRGTSDMDTVDLLKGAHRWPGDGRPIIWSTGPNLSSIQWYGQAWTSDEQTVDWSRIFYYADNSGRRLSFYQALGRGLWYPIPAVEK